MKVAIVHPWFLEIGGAERVVDVLAGVYPDADIFTLAFDPAFLPLNLRGRKIYTSCLNRILGVPFHLKRTAFMSLYPWAVEQFDLSEYDLIISSCGPAMMGVNSRPDAVHICYVHTPMRTWWDLYSQYQAQAGWLGRQFFVVSAMFIRTWEFCAMQRVDHVISNSNYISCRVSKYFCRKSTVIYPPVKTSCGYLAHHHEDYYFSVSRIDSKKRIDLLIQACNQLGRRLLIVGTGSEERRLKAIAGPTIRFLGCVSDAELLTLYAHCRAFIFAADEDFGIAPVEAQSFGRPVIAYGHGGSLETVRVDDSSGRSDTGILFPQQTLESVIDGIQRFEAREKSFIPAEIRKHAQEFDTSVFVEKMHQIIESKLMKEAK